MPVHQLYDENGRRRGYVVETEEGDGLSDETGLAILIGIGAWAAAWFIAPGNFLQTWVVLMLLVLAGILAYYAHRSWALLILVGIGLWATATYFRVFP